MRFSTSFLCFSSLTLLGPIYGQFLQQTGNYWPDYENAGQQQPWANGFQQNGQFLPAQAQQQQFYGQWPAQPGQQYYQPPAPPPPPPPRAHSSTNAQSSHQLPYASYRGSAFSVPPPQRNLDQSQKERLARIADESESFGTERRRSGYYGQEPAQQFGAVQPYQGGLGGPGAGDFQRILASVAEKLPRIAETMARLGGGTNGGGGTSIAGNEKSRGEGLEAANGQGNPGFSLARRSYEIGQESGATQSPSSSGALIDSMPEPASLFSFNKLLSAFGAGQRQGEKMAKGEAGQQFGDGQQPIELKGTPILKSEDLEPELILQQKSTKEGLFFPGQKQPQPQPAHLTPPPEIPAPQNPAQAHLTPPPEIPAPQNPLNSFLQQFGISNFVPNNNEAGITTAPKTGEWPKQAEEQQQQGENGDLFGSLMKGKMPQMPDWLKQFELDSMFGPNGTKPGGEGAAGAEEPGNVLAQLFGKGGGKGGSGGFGLGSVFGSGLDDVPRSRRR